MTNEDGQRAVHSACREGAVQIETSHFGTLEIEPTDILLFPHGVIAYENCRHWVLLADSDNPALAWLQSTSRPEVALPVVSPRRFAPDYRVHVAKGQLAPLEFSQFDQAYVLSIVSQSDGDLTLNLRAPLIINLDRRLGRQVITADEQSVAKLLVATPALRKSA
jgi:flagellar assembly factor FliW